MWIGILFGILSISTSFEHKSQLVGPNTMVAEALNNPSELVDFYREKIVQCLVLGNYTSPGLYTLECLLFYFMADHFTTNATQVGGWMVFGLVVRTAMRLGLHRDPSNANNISAFQAQMRRRRWSVVIHLDLVTSLQVGLPCMISEGMHDVKLPLNLEDKDFDEDMKVLPQNDLTTTGYSNVKHRICTVLQKIVEQANSTKPSPYEEVMALDRDLQESRQSIPDSLKVHDAEYFTTDLPFLVLRKFAIDTTYHKSRCILHREFLILSSSAAHPASHPYSTRASIDGSMRILHCQFAFESATKPGQPLWSHKWEASNLLTQDFLSASMILCLYLGNNITIGPSRANSLRDSIGIDWTEQEMMTTLHGSYKIWQEKAPARRRL